MPAPSDFASPSSASHPTASPSSTTPAPLAFTVWLLAAANLLLHILTAPRYGPHGDEMYYLACSHHLAAGYVDIPPLLPLIAFFVRHILGTSLIALRFLPALAAAALTVATAALARAMGAGRWAQSIAALAICAAPVLLIEGHWLTMNAFEPLLWTLASLATVLALGSASSISSADAEGFFARPPQPRCWLAVGAIAGLGMLNKYTMALWIAGLLLGLLLTAHRRALLLPLFYAGAALGLLIFLPNLLWLIRNHFPFLAHERNIRSIAAPGHGPILFLIVQVLVLNPVLLPLWIAGLTWLLFSSSGRRFRPLGWIFLLTLGTILALRGRDYYTAPAYPAAFAAGAIALRYWFAARRSLTARTLRIAYPAVALLSAAVLAPIVLPVLPLPAYSNYAAALGRLVPGHVRKPGESRIPTYFQDEFGWDALASQVASIYHSLPAQEQPDTAILSLNYLNASAIDYYSAQYQLPHAISGDLAFFAWGPRPDFQSEDSGPAFSGKSVILLGGDLAWARQRWRSVQVVGRIDAPEPRQHFDILLCRDPIQPLSAMWPHMCLANKTAPYC
jgi:hypothetical protein